MLRSVIASSSDEVQGGTLLSMAHALEEGLLHCWRAHRPYLPEWAADAPPVVFPWPANEPLPAWDSEYLPRTVALHLVDGPPRTPNTLGVHFVAVDRPAAQVFVDVSSGLNFGRHSAFETASHEVNEVLVNAYLDQWDRMPGQPGMEVAREVCDPTQRTYDASTTDPDGRPWQLANFTHPAWHGLQNPEGVHGYDHAGELHAPGYIGPEGYAILRDVNARVSYVYGAGGLERHGAAPGKRGGRTEALRDAMDVEQRRHLAALPRWKRWLRRVL